MNFLAQPIIIFFLACMKPLMILRRLGFYGTPDDPIYFNKGDTVPWWIECRFPLNMELTFGQDVETYFEGKFQHVTPLHKTDSPTLNGGYCNYCIIVGAPTIINCEPRKRKPKKLTKLVRCEA